MTVIPWNLQIQSGARSATWSSRTIFRAIEKIARYWAVSMPQVSRGAVMPIILVPSGKYAMWTASKRICVNASFRWGTSAAGLEQQALALAHEMGHWIGGSGHAPSPGSVMYYMVSDPYTNFTTEDMRWFGRLPWRSSARPWNEPNYWRPTTYRTDGLVAFDYEAIEPVEFGCDPPLWDSWRCWANGLFGNKVERVNA